MAEEKNKVKPETIENNIENTVSKDHSEERNITENTLELILGEKGYEYYLNNKKQVTLYAIIIGSLILSSSFFLNFWWDIIIKFISMSIFFVRVSENSQSFKFHFFYPIIHFLKIFL